MNPQVLEKLLTDSLQFFQVTSMILSDRPTRRVEGIFFHGRSFNGDDDGLFPLAQELVNSVSDNIVVVNGGNGEAYKHGDPPAWPGKDNYVSRLQKLKCKVILSEPAPRTLEEGFEFSKVAEDRGWKRAIVIAQPFQLLRILQVHLKVMQKRDYPMQIYAVAPRSVDWKKVTHGNQGRSDVSRFDQIEDEFNRLRHAGSDPKWREFQEENLASVPEVIEYLLRGRNQIVA